MTDLKTLALAAKADPFNFRAEDDFYAAASPDAILKLLEERDRLREALKEATQSLETIARLAGRKTYGSPPIDTYMSHFDEVRGYAASRAGVGRQALEEAR